MIGTTISHYKILEKLGEGGMGVVYKARDTDLDRDVALKFLPHHIVANETEQARFLQEARAAALLNHPNICTIHAIEKCGNDQFIAMEYVEGKTLREIVPVRKMQDAVTYAIQIAEALQEAHTHGIVHRDIKADNIMVNSKNQVKVMDFGLAKLKGSLKITKTSSTIGTLAYMAPEQIEGEEVDARSDTFSFGIVLYEMLTGHLPFRGEHEAAMIYSIVNEEPEPLQHYVPDAPSELLHILDRALEKDREDRYQAAHEMLIDLRRLKRQSTRVTRTVALKLESNGSQASSEAGLPTTGAQETHDGKGPLRLSGKTVWFGLAAIALVLIVAVLYRFLGPGSRETSSTSLRQLAFIRLTDQPGQEVFPDISPDGNFIVYTKRVSGKSAIFLHRVGGGNPINLTKDSKEDNYSPAYSPDGQWIAFRSDRGGGGIFIMGATGESVRRVSDFGYNPVWSADGKAILCATEGVFNPTGRPTVSQLWSVDVKTGTKVMVTKGDAVQPSCSPHGYRIAYWGLPRGSGTRVIWTIPARGGDSVAVTEGAATDWDPVWSPDGKYLYFSSDRGGSMNLWRVAIDEESGEVLGEAEPLTTPSPWSGQIKASRDGKSIVYVTVDTKSNVEKIAFDPAKERVIGLPVPVTQGARQVGYVDPSPDGQLLVYYSSGKQENLVVISNDGSNPVQLTNDEYKNRGPRWSPDGKRIMFFSNRSGRYELWCVNPDGSGLEQMTKTSGRSVLSPQWLPDGEHVFFKIQQQGTFIIDLKVPIDERKPQPFVPARGSDTVFSVNSVSPDGRFLAGYWEIFNGEAIPRVLIYSLQSKTYRTVTDSGVAWTWLNDSRRLLYDRNGRVYLVDTQTKKSHQILAPPEGEGIYDLRISRDNRMLYYVSGSSESDIWQAAIK